LARVSEHYNLGRSQGELDFVDVDIDLDTHLFVDPAALRHLPGQWAHECVALIQDFFQAVITAIGAEDDQTALRLLRGLREPNETRLGLSSGRPRGRALGPDSSVDIFDALQSSEATRTGLLRHLEDTALLVRGIGPDIVSDITTNLIRAPLLKYTDRTCRQYGIPSVDGVASGPLWDPGLHDWHEGGLARLPIPNATRLLLVPKAIVRRHVEYDADEYLHHFIIPVLEDRELSANTELVRTIKYSGAKKVTKKDLIAKYGATKEDATRVTLEEDGAPLDRYRDFKDRTPSAPLDHSELVEPTGSDLPDWDALVTDLDATPSGIAAADDYHRTVEEILTAIFSPSLAMPIIEARIHEERKRIDIAYTNAGVRDFFNWVAQHYPAANVYVECKNYSGDPGNPELDQLAGRFSPTRGKLGFLCCRGFTDRALFIARCRDTALDHRGFIIALDDNDLKGLIDHRRNERAGRIYRFLKERFDELV
jgi:hypothetical protein